jgi:hypothetical protein
VAACATWARAAEVAGMLERAGADLSRLEFVPLDLMDDHGWREAMDGVRYLQHVASPLVPCACRRIATN